MGMALRNIDSKGQKAVRCSHEASSIRKLAVQYTNGLSVSSKLTEPAMQQLQQFFEHYSLWIFLLCFVWVVVGFGWCYYRHKQSGIIFPDPMSQHVRFHERAASGCSQKNIFTRLGGARNCLRVTVTDTEVWIRPFFPVSVLAQYFDLEHRIVRTSITRVQPSQSAFAQSILLDYRDDRGQLHRLSLILHSPNEFRRALDLQEEPV
jgi:hypothetical protein